MSEEATLDDFIGDDEGVLSVEPQGVRLALGESYPKEWGFAELEEVCEINSGFTWNKEQETDSSVDDTVPVIKIGNVQDGYLDLDDILYLTGVSDEDLRENKARKDWLLMIGSNGSGERVGHCGIIEEDMEFVYASFLYGLHADSHHLLPRFLFYSLNRPKVQQRLTSFTAGSTSLKNLNKSVIENLSIPTPPLSEQRKIATVLYTVDRVIEKTKEIIQQYENLKSGVLEDLLRRGVKDHNQIERNIGPLTWEMPDSWSIRPVRELAELVHGHQFRSGDFSDDGEVPVLKIGQITASGIDLSNADCIPEQELEDYDDYTIEENSPLIALSGATWGKTGYFESYHRPVLQNYRVGKVVADSSELNKEYLYYLMESSIFQKQLRGQVVRQAQENIGKSDFERIRIPIPEINEQERIANIMSDIEGCIQNEERSKQTLEHLKRGLMQDILSGKVHTTNTNIQVPEEIAQYG